MALTIYLLGCILSYFRAYASMYSVSEEYMPYVNPKFDWTQIFFILIMSIFSIAGFVFGIMEYFFKSQKYFFKSSIKPLIKLYNKTKF